jgi:hypothetical protein
MALVYPVYSAALLGVVSAVKWNSMGVSEGLDVEIDGKAGSESRSNCLTGGYSADGFHAMATRLPRDSIRHDWLALMFLAIFLPGLQGLEGDPEASDYMLAGGHEPLCHGHVLRGPLSALRPSSVSVGSAGLFGFPCSGDF